METKFKAAMVTISCGVLASCFVVNSSGWAETLPKSLPATLATAVPEAGKPADVHKSEAPVSLPSSWNCGENHWVTPPTVEDGLFRSTLTAECLMSGGSGSTLSVMADFLRSDIEKSGKLQIHKGPTSLSYEGLPAVQYDVTDDLKSEGSPVVIRQDLLFATDQKTRLIYFAKSTNVQGSGTASYLKAVSFLAEVIPVSPLGTFRFRMTNSVQVQRPWYALNLIFEPIAKSTAVEKFTHAKDKILAYLAPHLK